MTFANTALTAYTVPISDKLLPIERWVGYNNVVMSHQRLYAHHNKFEGTTILFGNLPPKYAPNGLWG